MFMSFHSQYLLSGRYRGRQDWRPSSKQASQVSDWKYGYDQDLQRKWVSARSLKSPVQAWERMGKLDGIAV